jgi:hypothetical protein
MADIVYAQFDLRRVRGKERPEYFWIIRRNVAELFGNVVTLQQADLHGWGISSIICCASV